MASLRDIRGIYFDLWNTLAFTDQVPRPMAALAEAYGLSGSPAWRRTVERVLMTRPLSGIGAGLDALAAHLGHGPAPGWTRREIVLMWGRACNRNRLAHGALETLTMLRGEFRLGILSNTQSFDLDFLEREGVTPLVDTLCLSCHCGLLKPDPAIYDLAARRMGLPAGRILMVGDDPEDDGDGPRRAGFRALTLDPTGRAAAALRRLADLPDLLARR